MVSAVIMRKGLYFKGNGGGAGGDVLGRGRPGQVFAIRSRKSDF